MHDEIISRWAETLFAFTLFLTPIFIMCDYEIDRRPIASKARAFCVWAGLMALAGLFLYDAWGA